MVASAVLSAGAAVYSANQQKHAVEDQLKLQQKQTNEAASAQTEDRLRAMREQRAAARAASAESGVSGNSVDAVLSDIQFQAGRDVSRIEKNRENGNVQAIQQARSASAEINGNLAQGLAGSIGQGMNAYGSFPSSTSKPQYNPVKDGIASDIEGYKRDLSTFTISG